MKTPETEWFVGYAGLRPLYGKDQHYIVEHHDDGTSTIKIYSAPGVLDETEGPLDEAEVVWRWRARTKFIRHTPRLSDLGS